MGIDNHFSPPLVRVLVQVDDGAHAVGVDAGGGGQLRDGGRQAEAPPRQAGQVGQDGAVVAPPRQYLRLALDVKRIHTVFHSSGNCLAAVLMLFALESLEADQLLFILHSLSNSNQRSSKSH